MLSAIEPRRRAGLQPAPREAERLQRLREIARRRLAGAARRPLLAADVNQAVEERAGGDDERVAPILSPSSSARPATRPSLDRIAPGPADNPRDVRLALERAAHPRAVAPLVGLRARRPDRRTAAAVEQLELDAGRVDRAAHQSAERIDLANQMPLRRAADRRIARHVRDGVASTACRSPTLRAHARRGPRGFDARVPGADDDDVEVLSSDIDTSYLPMQNRSKMCLQHVLRRARAGDLLEAPRAPRADPTSTNSSGTSAAAAASRARASASRAASSSATCRTFAIAGRSRSDSPPPSATTIASRSSSSPRRSAPTRRAPRAPRVDSTPAAQIALVHHDRRRLDRSPSSSARSSAVSGRERSSTTMSTIGDRRAPARARAIPSASIHRRPRRAGPRCRRASPRALDVDRLGHQVARGARTSVTIARSAQRTR